MRVLVAYASKHGSTEGIAERLGEDLRGDGHEVDVRPASEAKHPEEYDAFVIGSAAYAMHWMKEASSFVKKNKDVLADRPVWLFSSGPLGTDLIDKEGHDVIEASVPKEATEFAFLHPRDHHVFFGALDFDKLGLTGRMLKKMPATRDAIPEGDFRDWDDIDRWAHDIGRALTTEPNE
ncbi:MAG TPA: flavodoxin domain-containing protein [Nocardioidaceae bacterium]|nr:flavodoxin domain-containing protein [Nocardioidaceae bacterium]